MKIETYTRKQSPALKTKLHRYCFNIGVKEQDAAYAEMLEQIKQQVGAGHQMHVHADRNRAAFRNEVEEVELETNFLFENQWNTTDATGGERVFDWFEATETSVGKGRRVGHWLEITPEMREIRDRIRVCGYTSQHFDTDYPEQFNLTVNGLGSSYLKESELHLLRLKPVSWNQPHKCRESLTDQEKAELLPLYVQAQTMGDLKRDKDKRKRAREDALKSLAHAETAIKRATEQRDAIKWLIKHDVNLDNMIYYPHTGRFCFGWQGKLSPSVAARLREILCEFPFDYDIEEEGAHPSTGRAKR